LNIVAVGGGTGLSTLLQGLKQYTHVQPHSASNMVRDGLLPAELTAVVTVTDDGGSSGRLRREFDVLPPGDIRNCMVALSEDEALLSRLFQHRFKSGSGLKGHSFGNLFLTALTQVIGDFGDAVKVSSEILAIRGRIYPSTRSNVSLEALLEDGTRVAGETRISRSKVGIERISLKPRKTAPLQETLDAISDADLITLGPGSLFTSVIPNLLVGGIAEAIERSRAVKAYFSNLMWQPGETMFFSTSDHVDAIYRHARRALLDYVIVNTRPISRDLRRAYAAQRVYPVEVDVPRLVAMGVKVIGRSLLADAPKIRHDPAAVASVCISQRRSSQEIAPHRDTQARLVGDADIALAIYHRRFLKDPKTMLI
jgi:uncharacterized cofD-like protein